MHTLQIMSPTSLEDFPGTWDSTDPSPVHSRSPYSSPEVVAMVTITWQCNTMDSELFTVETQPSKLCTSCQNCTLSICILHVSASSTVDWEIFALLFFCVRKVRAFNFHHMAKWRILNVRNFARLIFTA